MENQSILSMAIKANIIFHMLITLAQEDVLWINIPYNLFVNEPEFSSARKLRFNN